MRFYVRTYLMIMLVILSSTLFSSILVRDIFLRTEQREISSQLKQEADTVNRNIHRKTQQFWQQLIEIDNHNELITGIQNHTLSEEEILRKILSHIRPYGADFIITKKDDIHTIHQLSLNCPHPDAVQAQRTRWHPSVRFEVFQSSLFKVGTLGIPIGESGFYDIFIMKEIDGQYCESLTYGTSSNVVLMHSGGPIIATLPVRSSPFELTAVQEASKQNNPLVFYDLDFEGKTYHMRFQHVSRIEGTSSSLISAVLYRSTTLEQMNIELQARMFLNLLAGALLASVITIFISRMVTKPMSRVHAAMGRIESRDYKVSLTISKRQNREMKELYTNFNRMANQLYEDQEQQKQFIHEITLLKDFNEQIIESLEAGIATVTPEFIIDKHNIPFTAIFGYINSVNGAKLQEINSDCFSPRVMGRIAEIFTGKRFSYRQTRRLKFDRIVQLSFSSLSHSEDQTDEPRCLVVVEDITDKTKLEERMFQAERMNSLSILSAGVAHEINNPLGSVLINVQGMIDIERDAEKLKSLHWIEQDTRRISYIVKDMLDFSSSTEEQGGDIKQGVNDAITIIQRMDSFKRSQVQIFIDIPDNLPITVLSLQKIQQIVINMVQNALHAMGDKGELRISARNADLAAMKDPHIHVAISDSGTGIPKEVIPRIFDPFYTTKKNGTGTGLGLSVVYGLIHRCGGTITVNTQENKGTTFILCIPILDDFGGKEQTYGTI